MKGTRGERVMVPGSWEAKVRTCSVLRNTSGAWGGVGSFEPSYVMLAEMATLIIHVNNSSSSRDISW